MSSCSCWIKRNNRRFKRWQREDPTGPTMLSAVHTLMQSDVFSKHEWKAKAVLATAVLAFSQRTSPASYHAITDTEDISVSESWIEVEPSFEVVAAEANDAALKETVIAYEKITSVTTINEVTSEIATAETNYPLKETVIAGDRMTSLRVKTKAKMDTSTWSDVGNAISDEVESCAVPRLVYYRLMVPNWLRQHATWSCDFEGDDLDLDIKSDASNWENIFRIQISPACQFMDCDDITVKMNVGVLLPEEGPAIHSNMSYMISDGLFAFGFQLTDPQQDYATQGPYLALEGEVGSKSLRNPNTKVAATVYSTSTKNPNQFELRFKPSEAWGSAYCASDEGHKIVAQYSTPLKLSNGLRFEVYRHHSKERYRINYVEFFVFKDSPSLPPVPLKCSRQTVC